MGDALQGYGGEQCVSGQVKVCSLREMRVMFSAWVAVHVLPLTISIGRIYVMMTIAYASKTPYI
ncbi:MAG: hypothetical protein ACEQSD_10600, partial [Flavobacteriales bacterium]